MSDKWCDEHNLPWPCGYCVMAEADSLRIRMQRLEKYIEIADNTIYEQSVFIAKQADKEKDNG